VVEMDSHHESALAILYRCRHEKCTRNTLT
jgi:hypothetical protein